MPFSQESPAEELATLRVVGSNEEALKLFVVSDKGHAAIAVSPDEGFIRDSAPVPSAIAVADLPDAETATAEALKACDAARKGECDHKWRGGEVGGAHRRVDAPFEIAVP